MSDEKKHKPEPMLLTPPWLEMRALFENVEQRMFLDVLGQLSDVAPGTSLADVEEAEETPDGTLFCDTLFGDMSSATYDVVRLVLYSLGVLRPTGDREYSRDLMPRFLDVDPVAARAILAVVLACDNDMVKLSVAPKELLEAHKKIEELWHAGEGRACWSTAQTRVLTDAELCQQALEFITHAKDMCAQAVLIEVAHRWLVAKGLHTGTKNDAESTEEPKPLKGAIMLAQMIPRYVTADEVQQLHRNVTAGCYSCVKCLSPVSPADINVGRGARRRYSLDGVNFHDNGVLCADCDKIVKGP